MSSMPYFDGHSWSALTREERLYCFTLYQHAKKDPADFSRWVAETAVPRLSIGGKNEWDVGVEVCFYRDLLWHRGRSARGEGFPFKRTFDLCLFGTDTIIIIEAKAFEPFNSKQNEDFAKDAARIRELPGLKEIRVVLVALASSKYLGNNPCKEPFDACISWDDAFKKYRDELLSQADRLFGSENRPEARLLKVK